MDTKIDITGIFSPIMAEILFIKACSLTILEIQMKDLSDEERKSFRNLSIKKYQQIIKDFAEDYPEIIPDWNKIKSEFEI